MNIIRDIPFFMSLAAPRRSGKSYLICEQLRAEFIKRFDHIYIFSPSIHLNGDYDEFEKYENVHLISNVTPGEINSIFDKMVEVKEQCRVRDQQIDMGYKLPKYTCPETLIILDDCVDSNLLNFKGCVDKIAERGRHCNISAIVSSQRLSAISRSIRINSDIFLIFIPYQARELEQFIEQFIFKDQRKAIYECMRQIFDVPYRFLFIDNTEKNLRDKLKTSIADDFIHDKYEVLNICAMSEAFMSDTRQTRRQHAQASVFDTFDDNEQDE